MSAAPFVVGPVVEASDGVAIATYDLGGEGPPLILAHATGFHGRVWLPAARNLRDHFHCWAFDFRFHGASGRPPSGDYHWDGFGRDVLAVVAGLRMEQPFAVGHSSGGAAVLLAEEARSGTFAALYCYEPVVPADRTLGRSLRGDDLAAAARRRRDVFPSRAEAFDNYRAKQPFPTFDPDALSAYVEWGFRDLPDGTVQLACRPEDEARIYEAVWDHQAYARLHAVACPVALASGGPRSQFGVEIIKALAARMTRPTRIEVHDELGHFGPLERPQIVAAAVTQALAALASG